jgi:hypothetical protein
VSRRQFLVGAELATVGALVASSLVPTMWGKVSSSLAVAPSAVGLTRAMQASAPKATQLLSGTELFQDTLYASPVIAANEVHSHAVIEGVRGRLRV